MSQGASRSDLTNMEKLKLDVWSSHYVREIRKELPKTFAAQVSTRDIHDTLGLESKEQEEILEKVPGRKTVVVEASCSNCGKEGKYAIGTWKILCDECFSGKKGNHETN